MSTKRERLSFLAILVGLALVVGGGFFELEATSLPPPAESDDAAYTIATDRNVPVANLVDDTATDSVDEGDSGIPRMSADRVPYVQGEIAHDAADGGNPLKIGAKAVSHDASPTSVAASDMTDLLANRAGVQFVIGGHPNVLNPSDNISDADGAQTDTIVQAVGASEKFVVTSILVTTDNANTVDVSVQFEFDDGADVRIAGHPGIPAGGGFAWGSGAGILAIGAAGQDILLTSEDPTTGSFEYTVTGYLISEP